MADRETQLFLSASSAPSNFGATVYGEIFRRRGVNAVYLPRKITDAVALVAGVRALGVRGCSVSMPLKSDVVPLLDEVDADAERVSSVNTIVNDSGRLRGFNTDAHGFRAALTGALRGIPASVVLHGAGSVAGTVVDVLRTLGVTMLYVAARDGAKANAAADRWRAKVWAGQRCDLLINATPASLAPLDDTLRSLARSCSTVFDLVVPSKGNHLAAFCAEHGIAYVPGFEMYKHQCAKQIELYTGMVVTPDEIDNIVRAAGLV